MEKLQFEFVAKTQPDGKSNFIVLTSIITQEGTTFAVPEEHQAAANHPLIIATEAYTKIRNSLKKDIKKNLDYTN